VTTTENLIESLAADARPVRRLWPPFALAGTWLVGFLILAMILTLFTNAWPAMIVRLEGARFAFEIAATFATGITAIIAAFYLSLPDRSRLWLVLPLPTLLGWLGSNGYECYGNWVVYSRHELQWGDTSKCFVFIVGISIPMAVALYLVVRRARPLDASRVMMAGGLGIAALAATLLQFYHPFDVTFVDLAVHMLAVLVVVVAMTASGAGLSRFRPYLIPAKCLPSGSRNSGGF